MRRLACLVILALLTGCPDSSPPAPVDPAPSPATTSDGTDKGSPDDAAPVDEAKTPEGLDTTSKDAEGAMGLMAQGKDPVCKMDVDLNNAKATYVWGDTTYVFCAQHCLESFKKNPKKYVK